MNTSFFKVGVLGVDAKKIGTPSGTKLGVGNFTPTQPLQVASDDGGSYTLVANDSGNVGIGTNTPYAKLHVNGLSGSVHSHASYFNFDVGPFINTTGNFGPVSMYASDDIIAGAWIGSANGGITASDERIKADITDIDDGDALTTLRLLKPKQYRYKDYISRGSEPVWGFIAQEVSNTLPHSTQLRTECLPNIYEMASVSNSNVITFTNFDTSTLESNAFVLKLYDTKDVEHLITLNEVIDEHTIRVSEDLGEWIGSLDETGNVVAGNQIFVYGQQVNDFTFLKKDAIWTVATAALQEVDKQLQAERSRNDALEARILSLETLIAQDN